MKILLIATGVLFLAYVGYEAVVTSSNAAPASSTRTSPSAPSDVATSSNETKSVVELILHMVKAIPFTLILQADILGGSHKFLKSVQRPDSVVVVPAGKLPSILEHYSLIPTFDVFRVYVKDEDPILVTGETLLQVLKSMDFQKVFINHVLGFPVEFMESLADMGKRMISITHDYTWLFDRLQLTYEQLLNPEIATRNYHLKKLLPRIEFLSQTPATKKFFSLLETYKSLEVAAFPDYNTSGELHSASSDLVIAAIGDISEIKGIQALLDISRQNVPESSAVGDLDDGMQNALNSRQQCDSILSTAKGDHYVQIGSWRIGLADEDHLSISHESGTTAQIFRSDMGAFDGPRTDYTCWIQRASECNSRLGFGDYFIQFGNFRLGVRGRSLVLSHFSRQEEEVVIVENGSHAEVNLRMLWDRPLAKSNVFIGDGMLDIGHWTISQLSSGSLLLGARDGEVQRMYDSSRSKIDSELKSTSLWLPDPFTKGSCSMQRNVRVTVFGGVATDCGSGDSFSHERYDNIDEFNALLLRERPNVIVVTALWPETYSYTLTLAMLTNLPIIVRKQENYFESAVLERVAAYPKVFFQDFQDIPNLVNLANNVKGDSFTTVKPVISVSAQWNHILQPRLVNAVLIPSKIVTSETPLWYSAKRSRFSVDDRFHQTLRTISSVRKHIPNSYVILVDNSRLPTGMVDVLRSKADLFRNDLNDAELRQNTDFSPAKQLGETAQTLRALDILAENSIMCENIFKITGRYFLNDNFQFSIFDNENNVFKLATSEHYVKAGKTFYAYTSFYKIHFNHVRAYRDALSTISSQLKGIESAGLPSFLHDDYESKVAWMLPSVSLVESMGLTQRVSVWETPDVDI